jgi:hypothetical protein
MMMKTLICFVVAAAMVACTFPPQKQQEVVTQAAPERPIEPEPVLPVVEVKAKPIKAKPVPGAPLSVPPNPCLGIAAPELKEEIHEKLDCLEESLK